MEKANILEDNIETHMIGEPEIILTIDANGRSTPMTACLMVSRKVQGRPCSKLLNMLLDSEGSTSMCHRDIISRGARIRESSSCTSMNTLAGTYASLRIASMKGLRLPAFDKNRIIDKHECLIFDADCRYDVKRGGDFLAKEGMSLDYKNLKIERLGNTIPMENLSKPNGMAAHVDSSFAQIQSDDLNIKDSYKAQPILDAKYDKVAIGEVIEECSHLNAKQKEGLKALMLKYSKLFGGSLGKYPGDPMHIELKNTLCQSIKGTIQSQECILKPSKKYWIT